MTSLIKISTPAVGLILAASLTACGPSGTGAATGGGQAAEPVPAFKIGDKIKVGDAEITLKSVKARDSVGSAYFKEKAAEGGTLVIVEYAFKNVGAKPIGMFDRVSPQLLDPAGQAYGPDAGKAGALATETKYDTKLLSDLNPGITTRGGDVFEVAADKFDRNTWKVFFGSKENAFSLTAPSGSKAP